MNRRELLKAAAALPLAQIAHSHAAFAQSPYPSRTVTMIVPFPARRAGRSGRAPPVALALERILGKPVIVDNRAGGGGGSVGNAAAARAEPDGHTLLMTLLLARGCCPKPTGCSTARWPTRFRSSLRLRACSPIRRCSRCRPRRRGRRCRNSSTTQRSDPGKFPTARPVPTARCMAMEMFAASAGIKLLHVPFRGAGPALTALLSGTIQAVASAPGTLKQQVDDGKMRVLAGWGAERVARVSRPADLQGTRLQGRRVLHLGRIVRASEPCPRRS